MRDVAQTWFDRKTRVFIEDVNLLPQENVCYSGHPLVVARGQAQAFYLEDENQRIWILKKFLPGRKPDTHYIRAVQALVPKHPGFESGYQRKVLSAASVNPSGLPSTDFPSWLDDTILMPRVKGSDWAVIADKVRDGTISLSPEQRLILCRNLSEKIAILERNNISHRDLSSTNIFIDANTWDVHLIDWDSLYHQSLTIPSATTFGTNGYVAPFVKVGGKEDANVTWTLGADRFSMAILNIEFLSVDRNSPVNGDGGLFDQDEIYKLGGSLIGRIGGHLGRNFSNAFRLFDRIFKARNFNECPSPDEWIALAQGITAPSLRDVYDPEADFIKYIQQLQRRPIERPAPKLRDLQEPVLPEAFFATHGNEGPPAPRLADLDNIDLGNFLQPPSTPPRPAPRLADLNDPSTGRNQNRPPEETKS